MSRSTHTPYKLKGRDRDTDKRWTSLAVLDNGQVVGRVTTWSGNCYVTMSIAYHDTRGARDFKQYLLDNFQDNMNKVEGKPVTQRFYFKTHSQKELSKIINLIKEKKSYGKI